MNLMVLLCFFLAWHLSGLFLLLFNSAFWENESMPFGIFETIHQSKTKKTPHLNNWNKIRPTSYQVTWSVGIAGADWMAPCEMADLCVFLKYTHIFFNMKWRRLCRFLDDNGQLFAHGWWFSFGPWIQRKADGWILAVWRQFLSINTRAAPTSYK